MYLRTPTRVRASELRGGGLRRGLHGISPAILIGPAVVSPSGGTASSALLSAASGAAQGAKFGPIGAAVGAIAGAIAGIWASHAARAKGAQTENAAMNSAVQAFDAALKAIFAAANSGQISASDAASYCQQNMQSYWQGMAPYMTGPGRKDGSHGGQGCSSVIVCNQQTSPGLKCDSGCTAGCCVGCDVLTPTTLQAMQIFQAGGGTLNVCPVYGSGYGGQSRASYSLTFTPPTASATASSAVASLGLPATVAGIPTWLLALGGIGALIFAVR